MVSSGSRGCFSTGSGQSCRRNPSQVKRVGRSFPNCHWHRPAFRTTLRRGAEVVAVAIAYTDQRFPARAADEPEGQLRESHQTDRPSSQRIFTRRSQCVRAQPPEIIGLSANPYEGTSKARAVRVKVF
jgi:hypothetical protein